MNEYTTDKYYWLANFLEHREQGIFTYVKDFLPTVFDQYFLISWNYGIIDNFPFEDYPARNLAIADLNKQHEIQQQFNLYLAKNTEQLYSPISIEELASRFKIPYSYRTIDQIKHTPGISPLSMRTKEIISSLITHLAEGESLNLYVHDFERYSWWEECMFGERNQIKSAIEYYSIQEGTGFDSCSYLFPDDHSWCLTTLEDIDSFILACDNKTANKLKFIDGLEYFATTDSLDCHTLSQFRHTS